MPAPPVDFRDTWYRHWQIRRWLSDNWSAVCSDRRMAPASTRLRTQTTPERTRPSSFQRIIAADNSFGPSAFRNSLSRLHSPAAHGGASGHEDGRIGERRRHRELAYKLKIFFRVFPVSLPEVIVAQPPFGERRHAVGRIFRKEVREQQKGVGFASGFKIRKGARVLDGRTLVSCGKRLTQEL